MTTPQDFAIRMPTVGEIAATFGSAQCCLEITRGDLPTALYFVANPDRLKGFTPPPGARRVGYADFARALRRLATAERSAERTATHNARRATIEDAVREALAAMDPAKRLTVKRVRLAALGRMPAAIARTLNPTSREIRAAVAEINRTAARPWNLPEPQPRKTRGARR